MQQVNMAFCVDHVRYFNDPISTAVKNSIDNGNTIHPGRLKENLEKAGYLLKDCVSHEARHKELGYRIFDNLTRVLVENQAGDVLAMGASGDYDDALLHSMLGYIRERVKAALQAAG